jgi:hypothetical protein
MKMVNKQQWWRPMAKSRDRVRADAENTEGKRVGTNIRGTFKGEWKIKALSYIRQPTLVEMLVVKGTLCKSLYKLFLPHLCTKCLK